jgi:hypothetical protein
MSGSIAPIVPSDELFNHQIVDTFACVQQTDPAWAEKVCGMACARDGSLQLGFGIGKYTNRNVMDAYAGTSRGVEQRTVRASRVLAPNHEALSVGPIRYEIVEPLRKIRVSLDPSEAQPVSFEMLFDSVVPPTVEEREDRRIMAGTRHTANQIRYHQTGTASGWVEIEGKRTQITPDTWISTRDHSWGIRPEVGAPLTDLQPQELAVAPSALAIWNPIFFENPDGSRYAMHHYYLRVEFPGGFVHEKFQGGIELPDGSRQLFRGLRPEIAFHPENRRFQGGTFHFEKADGKAYSVPVEVVSDTGFHLGTGLYHGFDGRYHGGWQGELHVGGECVPDCSERASAERVHQIRDCVVRVSDPDTGAIGWGNCQTVVIGAWPQFGLDDAGSSFM